MIVELNAGTLALARVKAPDAKKAAEMYDKAPGSLGVLCVRHLVVETEATAKEALAKFDDGAEFAALAGEFSTEPNAKESGGALGGENNACITLAEYQSGLTPTSQLVRCLQNQASHTARLNRALAITLFTCVRSLKFQKMFRNFWRQTPV